MSETRSTFEMSTAKLRHGPSKPVFIVGMNGSGTTMLLDHMGEHPQLFGYRLETLFLPGYLINVGKYGDLEDDTNFRRLWDDMRSEFAIRKVNRRSPLALPDDWKDTPRNVGGIFDAMMLEFAAREHKTRWCEKTPSHVFHLDLLSEAFPNAKFIHIVRDGRDCAASCLRRWVTHPVGASARWREAMQAGRKAAETIPGRYLEVAYEKVIVSPEEELRRICGFLDVAFDDAVLKAKRVRPKMTGHSSAEIMPNKSNRSLLEERGYAEKIERIAGKELSARGYECKYPDSDVRVSRFDRFAWHWNDARAFIVQIIRAKAGAQPNLTWSLFWARIKATAKAKAIKR
jgi:hypothetical protein